jgi:predicted phosphohydrolase
MIIQYCSDLHLEFVENDRFLQKHPIKPIGDILILAGDITYWEEKRFKHWFFDYVSDNFEAVYYVPGNHEFYSGKDTKILDEPLKELIRSNVFMVNNQVITLDNCDLFFTALWSYIPQNKSFYVEYGVNDFRRIKSHNKIITSNEFNQLHLSSVNFLTEQLSESTAKCKIITSHHVPSHIVNPQIYKTSEINSAFVSEQDKLIFEQKPNYWIYGHHHANIPETELYETVLLTNQLGYVHLGENKSFKNAAIIEVG